MTIHIEGFTDTLARCLDFDGVAPMELEAALAEASMPLAMQVAGRRPTCPDPLGFVVHASGLRPEWGGRTLEVASRGS